MFGTIVKRSDSASRSVQAHTQGLDVRRKKHQGRSVRDDADAAQQHASFACIRFQIRARTHRSR